MLSITLHHILDNLPLNMKFLMMFNRFFDALDVGNFCDGALRLKPFK